jgi:N-acetylglucosamine-6-phosphate deacetylase
MTVVSAPSLLVGDRLVHAGAVVVRDGVIAEVLDRVPSSDVDHVRLDSGVLTAGLVDLQVNGCFGVDFAETTPAGWLQARRALARTGVTSFLPTAITAPIDDLVGFAAEVVGERDRRDAHDEARILGAHLEGPFLSPLHAGAHDPALMISPSGDDLDRLLGLGGGAVAMVTIAPEVPGAVQAMRRLRDAGVVVSVGHTDATAEQVRGAADAGASMVTHVFNAQRGLHHSEPGVPGTAFDDSRFCLGLIADLHHVAGPVVRLVFTAAAGRVVLVTDAVAAMGMPPGTYALSGEPAVVDSPGAPPRRLDGTLAGSALSLDQAVRNVVGLGIATSTALIAASRTPADVVGRPDLGRLEAGAVADLVWWDDELRVQRTWIGGVPVDTV